MLLSNFVVVVTNVTIYSVLVNFNGRDVVVDLVSCTNISPHPLPHSQGMTLSSGPIASALSNRFTCRSVVMVGGVIAASGYILSYFATSLLYMYVTAGFLTGLGSGLAYTPNIVMVGRYFNQRRSLANGLSLAGRG